MRLNARSRKCLLPVALLLLQMPHPLLAQSGYSSAGLLAGKIEYVFVGHLGQTDSDGRLLVWEASVDGEVTGTMKWWFVTPPPVGELAFTTGRVSYYVARWELRVDDELLLAGESAGKTVFQDGADGIWDGHGRVTEAAGKYAGLAGRQIYETGPVIAGSDPPRSFTGTGTFVIY